MAYLSYPFDLEKEMRMWKMWTHQVDNQIEGIIS
jgi:hypothetical protein